MISRALFRWTPCLIAAAAFAAAGFGAPPDSPDNALPAKRMVKSVEVVVTGAAVDANRIRANMATREGGPFSDETVERDIKNLYATGLVESVDISTQDVAGGVRVIVKVGGRGVVGDVTFVGNSVVDTKKLRNEVEIKVGQPVDETKLFAGQNKIREVYAKKGYADVDVTYVTQAMPDKKGFVRVVYTITEGQRNIIKAIRFEGLTAMSPKKLASKMKLKAQALLQPLGQGREARQRNSPVRRARDRARHSGSGLRLRQGRAGAAGTGEGGPGRPRVRHRRRQALRGFRGRDRRQHRLHQGGAGARAPDRGRQGLFGDPHLG